MKGAWISGRGEGEDEGKGEGWIGSILDLEQMSFRLEGNKATVQIKRGRNDLGREHESCVLAFSCLLIDGGIF